MFSSSHLIDHIVSELVGGQVSPQEVSLVPHHDHRYVCQASGHGYLVPGNYVSLTYKSPGIWNLSFFYGLGKPQGYQLAQSLSPITLTL